MKKIFFCAVLAMSGWAGSGALAASLTSGQGLTPGQQIDSDDGRFMLVLQGGDGNLVVYRKADMVPIWATYKYGGTLAVMQADRNFVVYKGGGSVPLTAIWDSKTAGANVNDPGNKLTMGNDGYLRLTDGTNRQLWTTAPPVGPCAGGTFMQVYSVCNNPGTAYQFQTVIYSCPPPLVFYPNQLGICPFVP